MCLCLFVCLYTDLLQTLAAEVSHCLLYALWEGLTASLDIYDGWNSKHVFIFVIWNFGTLHELGNHPDQPERKTQDMQVQLYQLSSPMICYLVQLYQLHNDN